MKTIFSSFKISTAVGICLLSAFACKAQSSKEASPLQLKQSFKLNSALLPDMKIRAIDARMKEVHINENPGVVCDAIAIQQLMQNDLEDIKCAYYELYQGKQDEDADAGVRVFEFTNTDALLHAMGKLTAQGNTAYLGKDNYLIALWSDDPSKSEAQLEAMTHYYENKIGAHVYPANPSSDITQTLIEEAPTPTYEGLEFGVDSTAASEPVEATPVHKSKKKKK